MRFLLFIRCNTSANAVKRATAGFTLLELLAVIVLLAILATSALVAYDGTDDEARLNITRLEMVELQKALLNFRRDNREMPCQVFRPGKYNPFLDNQYIAMDELDYSDLPATPNATNFQDWCSDSLMQVGEDIKQANNGLSMLINFPYSLTLAKSDLLWSASRQSGWNGAYISSKALNDSWGNPYKLLDPELTYSKRYKCLVNGTGYDLDIDGFYTCLPPTDINWNDTTYILPSDIVRIASSGPDGVFQSVRKFTLDATDPVNSKDPCLPQGDDLVLCLLR